MKSPILDNINTTMVDSQANDLKFHTKDKNIHVS